MDEIVGVLLMRPLSNYIQQELAKRFTLFKYWEIPSESLKLHSDVIRAVVGNGVQGANSALIDSLPRLEIVSSHSSGLDKIDLVKCKERGIRVTSAPDGPTDDVADTAILLTIATLRRICVADRFVRSGIWKEKDFNLTAKVHFLAFRSNFTSLLLIVIQNYPPLYFMLAVSIRVKRLFANHKDMNDPELLSADKLWIFRIQKVFLTIFPLN